MIDLLRVLFVIIFGRVFIAFGVVASFAAPTCTLWCASQTTLQTTALRTTTTATEEVVQNFSICWSFKQHRDQAAIMQLPAMVL